MPGFYTWALNRRLFLIHFYKIRKHKADYISNTDSLTCHKGRHEDNKIPFYQLHIFKHFLFCDRFNKHDQRNMKKLLNALVFPYFF